MGTMDISHSLIDPSNFKEHAPFALAQGDTNSSITSKNGEFTTTCEVLSEEHFRMCGFALPLGKYGIENGLDLSKYDRVAVKLDYKSPETNPKLRVAFRNFDTLYSSLDDPVSLKFNTITYAPSQFTDNILVPLNAFQVENWWREQYSIDFANSHPEFTNVSLVEVVTHSPPKTGVHEFVLYQADLYGELISEVDLIKLLLVVWLISAIWLIARQRNILKKISATDALTKQLNRRGISSWVSSKLLIFLPNSPLTMFYFDLDDFKKVNDSYGHRVGDELLVGFCMRLSQYLATHHSGHQYAFARLSGDEFTLVFKNLASNAIEPICEDILANLERPLNLEQHDISVHLSIGIAQSDIDTHNFEDLMAKADAAMYLAKKQGKNRFQVFDESVANAIYRRKRIAEKLRRALDNNQFHLLFMPIFETKSLETKCCEVLLRCNSPEMEGTGPEEFVPIAEDFNLIIDIDMWVIEATFKLIEKQSRLLNENPMIFCINISSGELHNMQFVKNVEALLYKYSIDPACIEFEITETSLIETDERSISILHQLSKLGFKLALDDFGTGYTAFTQLISYPVDSLKIDKSFISGIEVCDNNKATMVNAIFSIAQSYQLTTIAEGIETLAQYHYLREQHCDYMQGYWYSKPLTWQKLRDLIEVPVKLRFPDLLD